MELSSIKVRLLEGQRCNDSKQFIVYTDLITQLIRFNDYAALYMQQAW